MAIKPLNIVILGGGVAGIATALALTKFAPKGAVPNITLYEVRKEPGVIGGAVNLTPNALRLLDYMGVYQIMKDRQYGIAVDQLQIFDVHTGKQLAETSFRGPNNEGLGTPPYKALRVTRGESLKAMLEALDSEPNIKMVCGKKTVKIEETAKNVTITFEDGGSATGDLLLGCDGIHSVTRLQHVEPERVESYSGIANAFGFAPRPKGVEMHFDTTAINFAQSGMLLTSYCEPTKSKIYVGALLQHPAIDSRDGWKARGADSKAIKDDILHRFGGAAMPGVVPAVETAEDWFIWPVFTLSGGGKWATDRVMLLGDAAHAMPPQGESTGIVFEDTILFARILSRWQETGKGTIKDAFNDYEALRRPRIDAAFAESHDVVGVVKDIGPVGHRIKTTIIPWYLWWSRPTREAHFTEDVTTKSLDVEPPVKSYWQTVTSIFGGK